MAFATGARHELSFVPEDLFGITPISPAPSMLRLRHTGTTLNLTKEAFTSDEIRADRQISDARHGVRQVGGDISIELSYGAFDDLLAAALFGDWAGSPADTLKAGTVFKSFTLERRFTDISQFLRYTGCAVNAFTMSISPNAMTTGTLGIIGKDMGTSGTSLGTPSDVASNPPFDAFSGVIEEGGSAIATITAIELNLVNGIEPTFVVGSDSTPQLVSGRSNLTGTVSAYFENLTMLNKFLNEVESSIEVELSDPDGNTLTVFLPRIKYNGGNVPVQGEGALGIEMPFQALRDDTEGTNLVVTREEAE